jgi:ribonuclease D
MRKNMPARRLLRDDLLVELARREASKPQSILALRGMNRSDLDVKEIAEAIQRGLASAVDEPTEPAGSRLSEELGLLGQHLYTAFSLVCREHRVAPGLAGSVQDVRRLAAWYLEGQPAQVPQPKLLSGWRRHVVGEFIEEVMDGRWAISVDRTNLDHPLKLHPLPPP